MRKNRQTETLINAIGVGNYKLQLNYNLQEKYRNTIVPLLKNGYFLNTALFTLMYAIDSSANFTLLYSFEIKFSSE